MTDMCAGAAGDAVRELPVLQMAETPDNPWTDAKEAQLDKIIGELAALEGLKVSLEQKQTHLVTEQRAGGVAMQKAFLVDLAAVLKKHHVAVCAEDPKDPDKHAEVYYQFMQYPYDSDLYTYKNNRSHSTAGEYTCRLEAIK